MIKQQLFDFFTCCGAGFCGACFGLLFGFYDWQGQVYFDLQGAFNIATILFLACFVACLVDKLQQYKNNQNN